MLAKYGRSTLFGGVVILFTVILSCTVILTTDTQADPPGPPAETYPEWTHFYVFDGHITVVDHGDDELRAIMDVDVLVRGQQESRPLTSKLKDGEVLLKGAIENQGSEVVVLLTSEGHWLELEAGMRAVVSDEELYGYDQVYYPQQPQPNACLCQCGNGWKSLPIPYNPPDESCPGYVNGNCIDPIDHQLKTISQCVPGFATTAE